MVGEALLLIALHRWAGRGPAPSDWLANLASGGVLLVETFAHGNASVGKPSRPDFLLQPGELLQHCQGLRVVGFEDGFCEAPARYLQRICAVREAMPPTDSPARYHLPGRGQPPAQ